MGGFGFWLDPDYTKMFANKLTKNMKIGLIYSDTSEIVLQARQWQ